MISHTLSENTVSRINMIKKQSSAIKILQPLYSPTIKGLLVTTDIDIYIAVTNYTLNRMCVFYGQDFFWLKLTFKK